ncbi:MAG: aspartate/glutamate racemase family protein [Janthinobacterium lividum]
MKRFLLLNPNTNSITTAMMLDIARDAVGEDGTIEGVTAPHGVPVITDEPALAAAAAEVARMMELLVENAFDDVLIAAFGDPGLAAARKCGTQITGLAEAAIGAAAAGGRRFSIVTTTPALDGALRRRVKAYGANASFAGLRYTRSGTEGMADAERLRDELFEACTLSARTDGVGAIVIGGGPLAAAARDLRGRVDVELIEPIPTAMRAMLARPVKKDFR